MRHWTNQDHIDREIAKVERCGAHGNFRHGETMVIFTNQTVVCSSGHVHTYDNTDIPNLRTPELDPVEWVKANALKIVGGIKHDVCSDHLDTLENDNWGMDGHLYWARPDYNLTLCLPMTNRKVGE